MGGIICVGNKYENQVLLKDNRQINTYYCGDCSNGACLKELVKNKKYKPGMKCIYPERRNKDDNK